MNENKKMFVIGAIFIAVILIIPITAIIQKRISIKLLKEIDNYVQDTNEKFIYIGRDNCQYCQLFEPELSFIKEEYPFEYLYVNTNKLTKGDLSKLLKKFDINEADFGTPYLLVTKDGEKLSEQIGYTTEDGLFEYLKSQQIISPDSELPFNYLDYVEYMDLISSKNKQILVIGQPGCPSCIAARPILYEIARENNLKINYFNLYLINTDNRDAFQSSLSYFAENGIATPLMLVVSNNQVVASLEGLTTKEEYVEFLKSNDFIK